MRAAVALVLSSALHSAAFGGVLAQTLGAPTVEDEPVEASAGWDSWGSVDVELEGADPGVESAPSAGDPSPSAGDDSESESDTAAAPASPPEGSTVIAAAPSPASEAAAPKQARATKPVAKRRARARATAAAAGAGRSGPVADGSLPASPAPGIGDAERSSLLKDFVWVVSSVNTRDDAWHQLPRGPAGRIELKLRVDVEGRVVASEVSRGAPEHLQRLWTRTRQVLQQGRFAPRPGTPHAEGHLKLLLEARILDEAPEQTSTSDPMTPVAYGQTPPRAGRPGRAYFRFPSGRAVEILVHEVGAERR